MQPLQNKLVTGGGGLVAYFVWSRCLVNNISDARQHFSLLMDINMSVAGERVFALFGRLLDC